MTEQHEIGKGISDDMLGDTFADEEMDRLLAEDHDKINALI